MFKFIKYEIKGTFKFILGVLALVLILFTSIYIYTSRAQNSSLGDLFMLLSIMILFGTSLVVFLYIVGSFRKELYEDTGYLTFTLPLTGNQIVGAKLITALLWFFILGLGIALYNIIMVMIFHPLEMNIAKLFSSLHEVSIKQIIFVTVTAVYSGVAILVLIYFSMSLSKVTFRNKKIGGLWFIIFLVLTILLGFGDTEVIKLLPYYIDLSTFQIQNMDAINHQFQVDYSMNGFDMSYQPGGQMSINIASFFYNLATTVALFLGTGHLIEKKINL